MSSKLLDRLDAATGSLCACLCGTPITDGSPSAYFASEVCAGRWQFARTGNMNMAVAAARMRTAVQQAAQWLRRMFDQLAKALRPLADALKAFLDQVQQARQQERDRRDHGPAPSGRAPKAIRPRHGFNSVGLHRRLA